MVDNFPLTLRIFFKVNFPLSADVLTSVTAITINTVALN